MTLMEGTEFSKLLKQVKHLGQLNNEILQSIEARMDEHVTLKFEYRLECHVPQRNIDVKQSKCPPYTLQTIPMTQNVAELIDSWKYVGKPLKEDCIFESIGDLSLQNYTDVKRVTDTLVKMSDKYSMFISDSNETRSGLRIVLNNMEMLNVALRELKEMTVDAKNKNDTLQQNMEKLITSFEKISKIVQTASLRLKSMHNPIYPTFKDSSSLLCKATFQHTLPVSQLQACNHIGKHCLVTGSYKGSIKLWDLSSTADNEKNLMKYDDIVYSLVAYTQKNTQCLAAGTNGRIKLWDLSNSTLITILAGHSWYIRALCTFQRNNKVILVSGSADESIKLWDLDSNVLITTLKGHTRWINDLDIFHQGGHIYLASGSNDNTIKIWNLDNHTLVTNLTDCTSSVSSLVSFKQNGKIILAAGCEDGVIRLWDATDLSSIGELKAHSDYIRALAVIQCNGQIRLVSGSFDKTIKIWSLENKTVIRTLTGHNGPIWALKAIDNDGEAYLASGDNKGSIKIWSESSRLQ